MASIRQQRRRIEANTRRLTRREIPRKVAAALVKVGIVVGNRALQYVPLEYGALQNSEDREVRERLGGWQLSIVYTQDYAAALHERDDWSPRPPGEKKGPAWNPSARPDWLNVADDETRAQQRRVIRQELKL